MRVCLFFWLTVVSFSLPILLQAQQSVGIGTVTPNRHAALHVVAVNNDQGLLIPQLQTSQRLGIAARSPADDGLLVFDRTEGTFYFWENDDWSPLGGNGLQMLSFDPATSQVILSNGGQADLSDLNLKAANILIDAIDGITSLNAQDAIEELKNLIDAAGSDDQRLTLGGTILTLEDGGTPVDLSPLLFSGSFTDLSDVPVNLDLDASDDVVIGANISSLTNDAGYITSADDADSDPSNEEITGLVLSGNILEITEAGSVKTVDLSALASGGFSGSFTDLSDVPVNLDLDGSDDLLPGDNVSELVNDSGYITNTALLDNDPANETITGFYRSGSELFIEEAGSTWGPVDLGPLLISITSDDQSVQQFTLTGSNNEILELGLENDLLGVQSVDLHDLTFTGTSDLTGPLGAAMVKSGAIDSDKIQDGSITTADIQDNTVTADDLADGAVTTDELASNAVTSDKIADVDPAKINSAGASTGQVLKWDGSEWVPGDDNTGAGGGTSYYSIDPADFSPMLFDNTDLDKNHRLIFTSDNSFVTLREPDKADHLIAPVHLPHGAIIQSVTIFYWDANGQNIDLTLEKKPFAGSSQNMLSSTWTSAGNVSNIRNVTLSSFDDNVIDNRNNTYRIIFRLNTGGGAVDDPGDARMRIYAVTFEYTTP